MRDADVKLMVIACSICLILPTIGIVQGQEIPEVTSKLGQKLGLPAEAVREGLAFSLTLSMFGFIIGAVGLPSFVGILGSIVGGALALALGCPLGMIVGAIISGGSLALSGCFMTPTIVTGLTIPFATFLLLILGGIGTCIGLFIGALIGEILAGFPDLPPKLFWKLVKGIGGAAIGGIIGGIIGATLSCAFEGFLVLVGVILGLIVAIPAGCCGALLGPILIGPAVTIVLFILGNLFSYVPGALAIIPGMILGPTVCFGLGMLSLFVPNLGQVLLQMSAQLMPGMLGFFPQVAGSVIAGTPQILQGGLGQLMHMGAGGTLPNIMSLFQLFNAGLTGIQNLSNFYNIDVSGGEAEIDPSE